MTGAASAARARTFEAHREALVHEWAGIVALLTAVLVPLFSLLDVLTVSGAVLARFASYRAAVALACAAGRFVIVRTKPRPWSYVHAYLVTLLAAVMISAMTVELGGFDSAYHAGLTLVIAGVNLLMPWQPALSAVNGCLVVFVYVGANALWGGPFHLAALCGNLFFMTSTLIIAVTSSHYRHRLLEREHQARTRLAGANRSLRESRRALRAARDALWGEMQIAQSLQTALLPPRGRPGPWEIAGRMAPAEQVGGDYYDVIETDAGERWVAIGDVSGHGVESGLVMMMAQTSVATVVHQTPGISPSAVLRAVNAAVTENVARLGSPRYMTLNIVRLHDDGLTFAGKHQDVLVWRQAERRVDVVANDGHWIGIAARLQGDIADQRVAMAPGDTALFFTDGAVEAMSAAGEMFGLERLAAAFAAVAERDVGEVLDDLFARVAAFRDRQDDDVTMLVVRRAADPAAGEPARRLSAAAVSR